MAVSQPQSPESPVVSREQGLTPVRSEQTTDAGHSTTRESPMPPPVLPEPPNGGLTAWLQVFSAFFLNFNTWGLINTFGIFQAEYSAGLLVGSSQSAISWIGSTQAFLMLVVGVLCGRALDAGYFYLDITFGVFLEVFGMMMTSISSEYWQVILAQGIVVGIAAGMVFIPSLQIVGTYFSTRRSTAMGIAATGSGVGGVVYPIVLNRLIGEIGFRWAVRVMAFIMLGTLLIPIAIMRPRLPPRKSGPLVSRESLTDAVFGFWLLAVFFTFMGIYIPFFYAEQYAVYCGASEDLAFYMLIIMNAASVFGRIFPPMIADKIGNLSIMIPAVLISGVVTLAWTAVDAVGPLIVVSVFLGFTTGTIGAVLPASVAYLCPDLSKLGSNIGMTLFASGLGLLIGSPVAGVMIERQSTPQHIVFWGAWTFAGICVMVGVVFLCIVRVLKVGIVFTKA